MLYKFICKDKDITAQIASRIHSLELRDESGIESDKLILKIALDDGFVLPSLGAELHCQLQTSGGSYVDKGMFVVRRLVIDSSPAIATVTCSAMQHAETVGEPQERHFTNWTLGDVLIHIATVSDYRLDVDSQLSEIAIPFLHQNNESDMTLLKRLGDEHDAFAAIKYDPIQKARVLLFKQAGTVQSITGLPLATTTINKTDCQQFIYSEDSKESAHKVIAGYHNVETAHSSEVVVGDGKQERRLAEVFPNKKIAHKRAQAELQKRMRSECQLEVTIANKPEAIVEGGLMLGDGFVDRIPRKWVITKCVHSYSKRSSTTRITAEIPTPTTTHKTAETTYQLGTDYSEIGL